jgi:hypothetical protein
VCNSFYGTSDTNVKFDPAGASTTRERGVPFYLWNVSNRLSRQLLLDSYVMVDYIVFCVFLLWSSKAFGSIELLRCPA